MANMTHVHWLGVAVLLLLCEWLAEAGGRDSRVRRREAEAPLSDPEPRQPVAADLYILAGDLFALQNTTTLGPTSTHSWLEWRQWEEWNTWQQWEEWEEWNTWQQWEEWNTWQQWEEWNTWHQWLDNVNWERWNTWVRWNEWNDRMRTRYDTNDGGTDPPRVGRVVGIVIGVFIASLTLFIPLIIVCKNRKKMNRRHAARAQQDIYEEDNIASSAAGVPGSYYRSQHHNTNNTYEPGRDYPGYIHHDQHGAAHISDTSNMGYIRDRSGQLPNQPHIHSYLSSIQTETQPDVENVVTSDPPPYDEAIDSELYLRPDPRSYLSRVQPRVAKHRQEELPAYEAYMTAETSFTEHAEGSPTGISSRGDGDHESGRGHVTETETVCPSICITEHGEVYV